jgi:excinuclease ABC subunit B
MRMAIDETDRRRKIQKEHNLLHNITPVGIHKAVADITDRLRPDNYSERTEVSWEHMPKDEIFRVVKDLESQMKQAAKNFEFEKAALLRDEIVEIRRELSNHQ